MHVLERYIGILKGLQARLMKEARNNKIAVEMQRSLTKEAQKISDELKLMEDAGNNVVEIKIYAYEMYNSVPAGLEKTYRKIAQSAKSMKDLLELNKVIEEISKELEKFWYFVNQ